MSVANNLTKDDAKLRKLNNEADKYYMWYILSGLFVGCLHTLRSVDAQMVKQFGGKPINTNLSEFTLKYYNLKKWRLEKTYFRKEDRFEAEHRFETEHRFEAKNRFYSYL